uniref:Putative ovule protein n=1 Tax=Solanum chacoense TaxID=4108 RepID=A0A0V0GE32_SOLCH
MASRFCSSTWVSEQSSRALSTIAPLESVCLTLPMERCFLLFRHNFSCQIIDSNRLIATWNLGQGLT